MRLNRRHREHDLGFVMTPMIDIVFLLIIFFMTVSQITRVVEHPIALPNVSDGTVDSNPTTVTINLDAEGQIIIAGRPTELDEVVDRLRVHLDQVGRNVAAIKIELRIHRRCPSNSVNRLIQRLTQLGFTYVHVAVAAPSESEAGADRASGNHVGEDANRDAGGDATGGAR